MITRPGRVRLFSVRGVAVYIHWSFPLASFIACAVVRFEFAESILACLVFTSLILVHELAHAVAAAKCGHRVRLVSISGLGGECEFFGTPKSFQHALIIAAAGVLAQSVVLGLTSAYIVAFGWPQSALGEALALTLTVANGAILILNVIPWKQRDGSSASDGYAIWKLLVNRVRGARKSFTEYDA